ncbi:reverse transcriptase domain-containing protein, partial [Tanacetum coccineum]
MVKDFEDLMQKEFKMSSMGELTFFLGLQVKQTTAGIFLSQDKYVKDILNKFDFRTIKPASTPIEAHKSLVKDEEGEDVDVHLYRSMIVVSCIKLLQVRHNVCCLSVVPIQALKEAFSDSDYVGDNHDRRSTSGGCQYLRVSGSLAMQETNNCGLSSTRGEYVSSCKFCVSTIEQYHMHLYEEFLILHSRPRLNSDSTSLIRDVMSEAHYVVSPKSTSWEQFGTNIASALVGLATNQKFNFSLMIMNGMLGHISNVTLPSKVFTFMRKNSPKFSGRITPLTPPMLEVVTALAAEEAQSESTHSYQSCPATDGNVYHDNIQAYVFQPPRLISSRFKSNVKIQLPKPVIDPVSAPRPNQQTSIPFPSEEMMKGAVKKLTIKLRILYENPLRDLSSDISFKDMLDPYAKFAAVILNKLPKKLGDPGRFLILCEFSGINTCNALADLSASINLMPYSVWKDLSLPELTSTCMTLELADRSITEPIGIAKDVRLMVGKFQFPTDFVVVDFEPDPPRTSNSREKFLKDQSCIDRCLRSEEYSQEVLGFSDSVAYGNPSSDYDPIVSNSSPTLTPFGNSDFLLLEEANAFIAIDDESISREIDATYYDPEGDI